jgi:hypothetical protein
MTPTQNLDKYEILEELGRRGLGTVYRTLDTTLKREVSLKILNPALLHEEGWLARFQREVQMIASLDHPRSVAFAPDGATLASGALDGGGALSTSYAAKSVGRRPTSVAGDAAAPLAGEGETRTNGFAVEGATPQPPRA